MLKADIMTKYFIRLIFYFITYSQCEEYKIQFSTIPIGQGLSENNSVGVMNSVGAMVSKDVNSDSFTVGSGFLQTTQNVLSLIHI